MKKTIISLLITLMFGALLFYFWLPPINLTSPSFYLFLGTISFFYCLTYLLLSIKSLKFDPNEAKQIPFILGGMALITIIIFLTNLVLSPIFNARKYASRITVNEENNFTDDIPEADFNQVPLLDKASSQKLGDRKMGSIPELVSQYEVSDLYTEINYNNQIVRVTPLEYNGIIKYFTNHKNGIKAYITVNSVNGEANLVNIDAGMKYMPSALFNENLYRKLRFSYPSLIFDQANFEIDESGNPYWIVPYVSYRGVGIKKEIEGVVILDPITGESTKYNVENVPAWVDHVYSASLIIEELDNWGSLRGGFFNSIFGQKNVVNTTKGYNYLILGDDVYLYTGITSVAKDESNIGFILTNLRTKETDFYVAPGAEEFSAASSAEGLVQEKGYVATFPLLINLNSRPTYLMSLKDNAGLVKMYAFVDVEDYQKVVTTESSLGIEAAKEKYLQETNFKTSNNLISKEITITNIKETVIDGNTYYFLEDETSKHYIASIKINKEKLPFLKINDKITIKYQEKQLNEITELN